jgi:N-acetylglutamate synthase-like GNAT family acetyltransferase
MKSYVREHVKSISTISERKRRRDVVRGVIGIRLTSEDMEILSRVAKHFNITKSGMAETLLEDAIKDAAEELRLWSEEELNSVLEQMVDNE